MKWRAGLKGHQLTYDMHMVEKAIMNVHFWCGKFNSPLFWDHVHVRVAWGCEPPALMFGATHFAHAAGTPLALQGLILRLHHLVGAAQDGRMVS